MCEVQVYKYETDLIVNGKFTDDVDGSTIKYIAAAPADYRASFSGSGLPYFSKFQAYQNTPNSGSTSVSKEDKSFSIKLSRPNAYYENDVLVSPYLLVIYVKNGKEQTLKVDLGDVTFPYRTLKRPDGYNETFYSVDDQPVRSQEKIIRESSYDVANSSSEFWGLKPPF
tara:strand:+ start:775 stop:1281 length:507 start_codon:yes stop_codon:yes gene_type:complete